MSDILFKTILKEPFKKPSKLLLQRIVTYFPFYVNTKIFKIDVSFYFHSHAFSYSHRP